MVLRTFDVAGRLQYRFDDIDHFLSRERISDIGPRGTQEAAALCPACDMRTLPKKKGPRIPRSRGPDQISWPF